VRALKVHIEGSLYLESDEMQFILKEYTGATDKNGRELYKTLGYFPDIRSAVKFLLKRKIMQSTATTLKELLQEVESIHRDIESRITV
jgi:hypothetical protein